MRAHHDRRAAAHGRRRRGEVRDRAQRGRRRPPRQPRRLRGACQAARQRARSGRGGARRRGRRARRRGHQRRRRGLSGRLRRDRGSHPAPSACGHHLHRQRARAAHPGSRRGQDPQFQRLCAGRGRPRRGRASHHAAHRGGFARGLEGRGARSGARVRLRGHERRRVRWRLRLHQALRRADR